MPVTLACEPIFLIGYLFLSQRKHTEEDKNIYVFLSELKDRVLMTLRMENPRCLDTMGNNSLYHKITSQLSVLPFAPQREAVQSTVVLKL